MESRALPGSEDCAFSSNSFTLARILVLRALPDSEDCDLCVNIPESADSTSELMAVSLASRNLFNEASEGNAT